jgi:hypothetical protein
MREVEDDTQVHEAADESSPAVGEAPFGCLDPARELVRSVPRQARGPDAERVPRLERVGIALEGLDALHREHEPQARVVEVVPRQHPASTVRALVDGQPELGLLGERPLACRLRGDVGGVERADLDADAAGLEPWQPVPLEQAIVTPAKDELEQQVVVGVDDQRPASLRSS